MDGNGALKALYDASAQGVPPEEEEKIRAMQKAVYEFGNFEKGE